jgi:hypothetical protein
MLSYLIFLLSPPAHAKPLPEPPRKEVFVGYSGNTGHSTGPHIHIQEQNGLVIQTSDLNNYFRVDNRTLTDADISDDEADHKARGSRGIDVAIAEGKIIEAIDPVSISEQGYDNRSGYYNIVRFGNGAEFLLAHQLSLVDYAPPKPVLETTIEPSPIPPVQKPILISEEATDAPNSAEIEKKDGKFRLTRNTRLQVFGISLGLPD